MTRPPRERELSDPPPATRRFDAARAESFLTLLDHHQWPIRHFVASLVPPGDAEDVLQNTHLVLWREFDNYQSGTSFSAWALSVACHQVFAWRKRRRRDRLVFDADYLCAVAVELTREAEARAERAAVLAKCVARIPSRYRELVRLRYGEGRGVGEIAASLNSTPDAVYRMLSRVREELRAAVAAELARDEAATVSAGRRDGSPYFLRSRPCPSPR